MPADAPLMALRSEGDAPPKGAVASKARLLTLADLDGRTAAARRARELVGEIESDLGGGDHLSAAERQLVQRAAVLGAMIESEEVRWLSGDTIAVEGHLAAINAQRRVLQRLGPATALPQHHADC